MSPLQAIGRRLARFLAEPRERSSHLPTSPPWLLAATLRRGDVLLVEGSSRFATAVKYLTQSTWSHAALCIGDPLGRRPRPRSRTCWWTWTWSRACAPCRCRRFRACTCASAGRSA